MRKTALERVHIDIPPRSTDGGCGEVLVPRDLTHLELRTRYDMSYKRELDN